MFSLWEGWILCQGPSAEPEEGSLHNDDDLAFGVNGRKKAKLVTIMVEGTEITAMIDSRASIVITKHMGRDEEKEDKVYLFQSYRQISVYM